MKIQLKKIILTNFKGIKSLSIDFDLKETSLFGANEAGKTTVFDAFSWLLFGKDSQDRKDFNIKNTKYPELNRQEHQVEGIILIDGEETSIKRIYKEKWTKKKGSTISEMTGNEQEFYWNDVPLQAGKFAEKVETIAPESIFKLITNPLYFNSLNWAKRREFLFQLAGTISDTEIAAGNADYERLLETLKLKSLKEYKAEISSRKKILKDQIEAIPHRIDEVSKSLPEEQDWKTIEDEIKHLENQISTIDAQIADASKANQAYLDEISRKQNELHKIKSRRRDIEFELESNHKQNQNSKLQKLKNDRSAISNKIEEIKRDLNSKRILAQSKSDVNEGLMLRKDNLLNIFNVTNEKQIEFAEGDFCCPTCKRDFEQGDIESRKKEMLSNFMSDKNKALDEIELKGTALKKEIEENNTLISTINNAISDLEIRFKNAETELSQFDEVNKIDEVKSFNLFDAISQNEEYSELTSKVKIIEAELSKPKEEGKDTSSLQDQKAELYSKLDDSKKILSDKTSLEKGKERIKELKDQEAGFAQQLADLENAEYVIDAFNKAKVETVEARVNEKFQYVTFKMYNYTIEGNPVETCETMYKGVPFSDLNTAGKCFAGLDIINTLSSHYNVFAPVFLDNRESVTAIPFTESQIINLFVSPADKELRVA
jgi:exonuclease SbcC